MNREYTEQDYNNYMKVVEHVIWETEEKLKSYNLNTTIGEIYYGSGKSISSKKILDALFYMSINPNTKKEDCLRRVKKMTKA